MMPSIERGGEGPTLHEGREGTLEAEVIEAELTEGVAEVGMVVPAEDGEEVDVGAFL